MKILKVGIAVAAAGFLALSLGSGAIAGSKNSASSRMSATAAAGALTLGPAKVGLSYNKVNGGTTASGRNAKAGAIGLGLSVGIATSGWAAAGGVAGGATSSCAGSAC